MGIFVLLSFSWLKIIYSCVKCLILPPFLRKMVCLQNLPIIKKMSYVDR